MCFRRRAVRANIQVKEVLSNDQVQCSWTEKSRGDNDKGKCEKKQIVQGLVGIWTLARGQLVTLECVNQGSESRLAFQKGGSAAG